MTKEGMVKLRVKFALSENTSLICTCDDVND